MILSRQNLASSHFQEEAYIQCGAMALPLSVLFILIVTAVYAVLVLLSLFAV